MKNIIIVFAILINILSCRKEVVIEAGYGLNDWTLETHSSDAAPNYLVVFPQNKVNRLDIIIESNYWQTMQDDLAEKVDFFYGENPIYVPCQVFYNGKQWYDVGIRYKGNSSLSGAYRENIRKLPLRLEFNHFENENSSIKGQTFYGFKQLSLGNNFKDPSLIHEKIADDIFREFGVPAPQSAFYTIFIDFGEGAIYFGLYTMVEVVFDEPMLSTQFENSSGNCYKPEGDGAKFNDINLLTNDFFDNKTNNEASLADIKAMGKALLAETRISNPIKWRADLESVFDVKLFLKWLAANTTMQNWDTYGLMAHNYYLYNDAPSNLLKWIPWDNNEAFSNTPELLKFDFSNLDNSMPGPANVPTWPLIRYLYDDFVYKEIYNNYIEEFANTVFNPSNMEKRFTDAHNLILPYVIGENGEKTPYTFLRSPDDFIKSLPILTDFVSVRCGEVEYYTSQNNKKN